MEGHTFGVRALNAKCRPLKYKTCPRSFSRTDGKEEEEDSESLEWVEPWVKEPQDCISCNNGVYLSTPRLFYKRRRKKYRLNKQISRIGCEFK